MSYAGEEVMVVSCEPIGIGDVDVVGRQANRAPSAASPVVALAS
jgi:hypothetical protein